MRFVTSHTECSGEKAEIQSSLLSPECLKAMSLRRAVVLWKLSSVPCLIQPMPGFTGSGQAECNEIASAKGKCMCKWKMSMFC